MNWKGIGSIAKRAAIWALIPLAIAVALPFAAIYVVFRRGKGRWLRMRFLRKWKSDGKRILFVYSDSPNWQIYIEREILPKLSPRAVPLNYSRRAEWKDKRPLEARIWLHWCGDRDFNPMAIVFPDRGKARTVRFLQAFRKYKHGDDRLLRQKENELFDLASRIGASR